MSNKKPTEGPRPAGEPQLAPMLMEHAAIIILVDPEDGKLHDANKAAREFYGLGSGPLIDVNIYGINAQNPQEVEALLANVKALNLSRFETVHRKGDGTLVEVEVVSSPVETDSGRAFLSIINDVSQRNQAIRALAESEEKFRLISEQTLLNLGILQDGRFVYINQALAALVEYTPEDLYSWEPAEFLKVVHPDDRAFAGEQARRKQAGEDGVVTHYHLRFVTRTGIIKHTEIFSRTVNYNGRPADLLAIVDFSERQRLEQERRKLEQKLLHSQKMEAIGSLAAGVAHDFNNILQTIGGTLEILALAENMTEEQQHRLRQLDSSIERGAGLVRRLLTFSRKMDPAFKRLEVNRLLKQSVDLLSRTIPRMIEVNFKSAIDRVTIAGDAGLLEQVILNLGANARDAMPHGGRLDIEIRSACLASDAHQCADLPPGQYVHISVSDTGQGMDQETLEQIFDPFFTTKGPGQGTGLGLATARGVLKSHGGLIYCASAPGKGTTFDIYLPEIVGTAKAMEEEEIRHAPITGRGELILLVDDEQQILDNAAEVFQSAGYEVLKAITGEQALEAHDQHRDNIKLVVLDLGMPGMGGMACLQRLKKAAPDLKVIVASGYASSSGIDDVINAGADFFLAKPFRLPELLAKARELLDTPAD